MAIFNNKLTDEELEGVNGGGYMYSGNLVTNDGMKEKYGCWEVIDDNNGNVLARFKTEAEALKWIAESNGQISAEKYDWNKVNNLRNGIR